MRLHTGRTHSSKKAEDTVGSLSVEPFSEAAGVAEKTPNKQTDEKKTQNVSCVYYQRGTSKFAVKYAE